MKVELRPLGLFPLGHVVATPAALDAIANARITSAEDKWGAGPNADDLLSRHRAGDWGELDDHDLRVNAEALEHGMRLMSAYSLEDGTTIWIITEADRSSTTVLLPEDY